MNKKIILSITLLFFCFTADASEWKKHPARETLYLGTAGITAALVHESGHALAIVMSGGKVTDFGITHCYDEETNFSRDQLAFIKMGGAGATTGSLNTLLYLTKHKKPNRFMKYWITVSYLDFPFRSVECYWDGKSDVAEFSKYTDCPREVITLLGGVHLILYYPTIKAMWKDEPYRNPFLQLKVEDGKLMLFKTWKF